MSSLQEKLSAFDGKVAQLQPEILRLQKEVQILEAEEDRLTQMRDVARDTHTTLARKVTEARIAAQDQSGEVRLASHAALPVEPVGPRKVVNTVVAGVLGVILGVVGAFAVEWWRGTEVAQASE